MNCIDSVFYSAAQRFKTGNEVLESAPRNKKIKEILNANLVLNNPRRRLLKNPGRKFSLKYFAAEILWYLSGTNSSHFIENFASTWKEVKNCNSTINSAYGYLIFNESFANLQSNKFVISQFQNSINILKKDPDSRRAIIHINNMHDSYDVEASKDIRCTLNLQFFIRNEKLHMITNMRSNDLMWGFTYDVPAFTIIQELMANELGVELGNYYHNAGSLHIYDNHFELLDKVLDSKNQNIISDEMQQISYNNLINDILKPAKNFIQEYNAFKWNSQDYPAESQENIVSFIEKQKSGFINDMIISIFLLDDLFKPFNENYEAKFLATISDPAIALILEKELDKKKVKIKSTLQTVETNRPDWDQVWSQMALIISERSCDSKTKVGAIVVTEDNSQVLSLGYNGNYAGGPNLRDSGAEGESGLIHAEINALIKLDYNNPKNKIMYLTHSPCLMCAKSIINSGIKKVCYSKEFRDLSGLELLKNNGIFCKKIN